MTRVSVSETRPSASRTSRESAAPAARRSREAVQDEDVLHPVGAGVLEGVLKPRADPEVAEEPPALVDEDDQLSPGSPRASARARSSAIWARCQAAAQVIRIPSAAES